MAVRHELLGVAHAAGGHDGATVGDPLVEGAQIGRVVGEWFVNEDRHTCFDKRPGAFDVFAPYIGGDDDGIHLTDHRLG